MKLTFMPRIEEVDCKEWNLEENVKVYVKEPTAAEYAIFENLIDSLVKSSDQKVYAKIAVMFCVDGKGSKLFTNDFLDVLMNSSSKPLRRIAEKITELVKLDDSKMESLEKN